MRYFVHDTSNRKVAVDISPTNQLGKGATAVIYKVEFESEVVAAKVYHANKKVDEPKIRAMLSNKPDDIHISFAGVTYPQIAWPFATLKDEHGVTAGYLMPLVDLHDSFSLDYFYDQVLFKKLNAPDEVAFSYKLEIAKNLSLIVAALHKNKHYFIDLKPQNIRVFRQTHIVSLVDCDGFSVADKMANESSRFPAELISTDYISPEAFRGKISPKDLGENQDRYALAVILFQLLNNGTHPFQGILLDDEGIATNDEKAAAGLYPHSIQPNLSIKPRPQSIHFLWDDKTRALFDKAFIGKLDERPSAEEWARHFEKLLSEKSLIRCDKEPLNIAHMRFKGKECPTCYLQSLKAFKPNLSAPKSSAFTATEAKTTNVKTMSGVELFWLITSFIVFIVMMVGLFNKPTSHSEYSSNTSIARDPDYPSVAAMQAVNEAWGLMNPNNGIHDYKKAYELNSKGYNLGHPEGASNIGMLYEKGWGVDKNLYQAIKWYEMALTNHNHSAQAEIGLARVYLDEFGNSQKAKEFIEKAKKQLYESIWADHAEEYRGQIALLEAQISAKRHALSNKSKTFSFEEAKTKPKTFSFEEAKTKPSKIIWMPPYLKKMAWADAHNFCKESNFNGKKDWRLPTSTETRNLRYEALSLYYSNVPFPQEEDWKINVPVWTSETPYTGVGHNIFSFSTGGVNSEPDHNLEQVVCVHS